MVSPARPRRASGSAALVGVVIALLAAACSGQRSAPVPTRPTPPPTVTTRPTASTVGSVPDSMVTVETGVASSEPSTTPASAAPTTTVAPPTAEQWQRFDEALEDELIGRGSYSAAVAVRRHGRLLHAAAYGVRVPALPPPTTSTSPGATASELAPTTTPADTTSTTTTTSPDAPAAEPVEPTDRFRVASISKVITAAVVLQLVEAGELALDEPIGQRLADALGVQLGDPALAGVTVRQLLSHTSGFGTFRSTFFGGDAESCEEAGRIGLTRGLERPPGTSYDYSNMNYCLLGLLVEDVTGEPYEIVAQRRLLEPMGIEDMRMVATFDTRAGEVEHPSTPGRNYMEALGGAGSWVASAIDVVTIADALEGSRPVWHPLSQDMMALMRVPAPTTQPPPAIRTRWYGLGQIVLADGSWGHTGTVENTHAMFLVRPDGVTWAVLVSGNHPRETDDLLGIVNEALAEAGIRF